MEIFIRGLVALGAALAVASFGFSAEPVANADNGHGWAPCLRIFGHSKDGCAGRHAGLFSHGGHDHGAGPGAAGPAADPRHGGPHTQPGTVVFPQHPFARSPRDFFMMD